MRKIIFFVFTILLLNLVLANGITQQEINEAKSLIDSKANCKSLSDSQLEIIGEYYMEQMHPGESHDLMHKMMGIEEGTEYHKQFHVNIARMIHCDDNNSGMMGSGGMMGMMPMMMNMMGGGMMGGQNVQGSMMGNYGYGFGYWNFLNVLYATLLIGLIVLVFLGIIKLWKDLFRKRRQ